jgi:putative transposase
VGLSRDSYRNPPLVDEATLQLSARIVEIAQVRRRFGYRRMY